jgi:hypothetical protein
MQFTQFLPGLQYRRAVPAMRDSILMDILVSITISDIDIEQRHDKLAAHIPLTSPHPHRMKGTMALIT